MKTYPSKQHHVYNFAQAMAKEWEARPDSGEFVIVVSVVDNGISYVGAAVGKRKKEEELMDDLFNPGGTD